MLDNKLEEYKKFVSARRNNNVTVSLEVINYTMGLVGESAEVSEIIKKWYFHRHNKNFEELKEELGDTFFYFMALLEMFGLELEDIINANMEKLSKRYPDGFTSEDSIKRVDKFQK